MTTIDSYFFSDPGQKRANNEDAAGAFEPKSARQLQKSGCLYIVADGLGGHQMGEQASAQIVESLLNLYYEAPEVPPEQRLRDIIQQVNQKLIAARKDLASGEKMASTVVAAVVRNGTLLLANVGDSRAYLLRDDEVRQLTHDHSFVGEMMRAGALTEAEAQQSKYRNRLTRSVGGGEPNVEVEFYPPIPLRPGDLLLLCTDGLTQYATTEDLLAAGSYGSAREIVERLIDFANTRGGSDNITVSVIKYGKKSVIPALPVKTLALVGAGVLTLAMLALLSWYLFVARPASRSATLTPTAWPSLTAAPLPSLTSEPTQTVLSIPSESALPLPSESPAPPVLSEIVDCKYTVLAGEIAGNIVAKFGTDLAHLFREDGMQNGFDLITPGEILFINDISADACQNGGGEIQPSSTIP